MQIHRFCSQLRNEIGRPTLHRMRFEGRMCCGRRAVRVALLGEPAAQKGCVLRLAHNDPHLRTLSRQYARNAFERAPCAIAGDPVIKRLSGKIGNDLTRCGARMRVRISIILKLASQEPAMCLGRSVAFVTMPMPRSAAGVSTTLAPRKRMSFAVRR